MKEIGVTARGVKSELSAEAKKPFKCTMRDGSVFTMPNPTWDRAYAIKYSGRDQDEVREVFRVEVAKHWKNRTVPTKFTFDEPWDADYATQAALAEKVMYPNIRAPLMGLVMAEMTGGKVLAIGEGGEITEYGKRARPISDRELFGKKPRPRKTRVRPKPGGR